MKMQLRHLVVLLICVCLITVVVLNASILQDRSNSTTAAATAGVVATSVAPHSPCISQMSLAEQFRKFGLDDRFDNVNERKLRNPNDDLWANSVQGQATLVDRVLNGKRNGFFIEAGALDGEFYSNTIALEVHRDWTGLLVEPDPYRYRQLLETRRHAWTTSSCLSVTNDVQTVQFMAASVQGLSGIKENWKHEGIQKAKQVEMTCFPLVAMLDALKVKEVDYLSLDIEGAELQVLKTIPFDHIHFRLVSVECSSKCDELIAFMKSHVFGVAPRAGEDLMFYNLRDQEIMKRVASGVLEIPLSSTCGSPVHGPGSLKVLTSGELCFVPKQVQEESSLDICFGDAHSSAVRCSVYNCTIVGTSVVCPSANEMDHIREYCQRGTFSKCDFLGE